MTWLRPSKIVQGHRVILDVIRQFLQCVNRAFIGPLRVSEVCPILIGKRQKVPCLASVGCIQGARTEKGLNGCDRWCCLPISFQGERFGKPWTWICLSCQQVSSRHYYSHYSRKICLA